MARELAVNPGRCTGCCTCALTCAITHLGEFNLTGAFISIARDEFEGTFTITFSSLCRGCKKCALACPSGALRVVDVEEMA